MKAQQAAIDPAAIKRMLARTLYLAVSDARRNVTPTHTYKHKRAAIEFLLSDTALLYCCYLGINHDRVKKILGETP